MDIITNFGIRLPFHKIIDAVTYLVNKKLMVAIEFTE